MALPCTEAEVMHKKSTGGKAQKRLENIIVWFTITAAIFKVYYKTIRIEGGKPKQTNMN